MAAALTPAQQQRAALVTAVTLAAANTASFTTRTDATTQTGVLGRIGAAVDAATYFTAPTTYVRVYDKLYSFKDKDAIDYYFGKPNPYVPPTP
jgi:hypothetical protein